MPKMIIVFFIMFITFIKFIAIFRYTGHVIERDLWPLQFDERIMMNVMVSSRTVE